MKRGLGTSKRIRHRLHPFALVFVGYMFSLVGVILMYHLFLTAWFTNNTATIDINRYGEASVEFILIPIVLGIILLGLVRTYRLLFYEVEFVEGET